MTNELLLLSAAGLFSGVSQLINKKITSKEHRSSSYTIVIMLLNALLAVPLLFFNFYVSKSPLFWLLIIISATAFAISTLFSFKAYKETDVSVVSIVYRVNIILVALAGIIFLNESFSFNSYLGLFLIFAGSIIVAFNKDFKVESGVIFALLMAVFGSMATVLDKIILDDFSPFTYVFVNNLLVGLVFAFNRSRIKDAANLLKKKPLPLLITSLLTTLSFAIVLVVLQKTDISQTMTAYKGISFITPVFLGVLLLGEKSKTTQKLTGALLGLAGILLLYI